MNYFYDFKLDAWCTIEFILEGKKGTKVELAVGECLLNNKLNREPGGSRIFQTNEITLNGGIETFRFAPKPGGVQPIALKSPFEFEIIPFRYAEINGDEYTLTTPKSVALWPVVRCLNSERIRQARKYSKIKKEKCFNEERRKDNNQS